MAAKTNKQVQNEIVELENKLEIEKISKQISEHAEALYRTWKSTDLAVPREFLDFYAMEGPASTLDAVVATTKDINTAEDLQKLVNSFVIRDKEKRGILKTRGYGGKIMSSSSSPSENKQAKQNIKQMTSSLTNSLYQRQAAVTPILQENPYQLEQIMHEGQQAQINARHSHNKPSISSSKSLAKNNSSGIKCKSAKCMPETSRQTAIIAPYHTTIAIPSINTINSMKQSHPLQSNASTADRQENYKDNQTNHLESSLEYSMQNIKQLLHGGQKKNITKIPTLSASFTNSNSLTLTNISNKTITPPSNDCNRMNYSTTDGNSSKSYQMSPPMLNTASNTNTQQHNGTESEINVVRKADNRIANKKLIPMIKFSESNLAAAAASSTQTLKTQSSPLTTSTSATVSTPALASVFKQKKPNTCSKRNQEVRKLNNSNSPNNSSSIRINTQSIDNTDSCSDNNNKTSSANTIAINNIKLDTTTTTTTLTNSTTKTKRTAAITRQSPIRTVTAIDQLAAETDESSTLGDLQTASNSINSLTENQTKQLQKTNTKALKTNKNKFTLKTVPLTDNNTEAALNIITNLPSISPDEGMDDKRNHGRKPNDGDSSSGATNAKTMPTFIKNKLLGPDKNFRSPFLMRGSVAERVLIFEKCPDSNKAFPNIKRPEKIDLNRKMPFKVKLHSMPQSASDQNLLQKEIRNLKNTYIPRFHFPHGKPPPTISTERTLRDILSAFEVFPNNQATKDELGRILKICEMPFYWRMPVLHCCRPQNNLNLVERQRFIEFWKQMSVYCHDAASRFIYILSRGQRNRHYILPEDLIPLVQDVVDTHPGLSFLKEATEFHSRYIHTVISRIFYTVNRSWSGKINISELRRSDLLEVIALLEEEEDINQIMAYFSYEHFYVIYCKFWELDKDHDLLISPDDLSKYGDYALSARIIERLFSGCVTRKNKYSNIHNDYKMSYTDFVWFLLSEEDKRSPTAIEYWFRCMDVDGDGVLSMYELEYFYEEQQQRLESIGIESLPFEDCLCQMLDMIKPQNPGGITLGDLKRCKMTPIFFDTFFNLEKYLDHEQRDPFVTARNDYISDWDRFAAQEYEALIMEEND